MTVGAARDESGNALSSPGSDGEAAVGESTGGERAGSPWYSIRMTEKDARRGKAERLVRDIYDTFRGVDRSPSIAVFSAASADGFVEVFFSPAAAAYASGIIRCYRGVESPGPAQGAQLLLGSVEALE